MLGIYPVVFSDIFFQSPYCEFALVVCQPGGCSWEIRDNEEGDKCDGNYDVVSIENYAGICETYL